MWKGARIGNIEKYVLEKPKSVDFRLDRATLHFDHGGRDRFYFGCDEGKTFVSGYRPSWKLNPSVLHSRINLEDFGYDMSLRFFRRDRIDFIYKGISIRYNQLAKEILKKDLDEQDRFNEHREEVEEDWKKLRRSFEGYMEYFVARTKKKGIFEVSPNEELSLEEKEKIKPIVREIVLKFPKLNGNFLDRDNYVNLVESW